jgi:hypothetical protein
MAQSRRIDLSGIVSLAGNVAAWLCYWLRPRILRDVRSVDASGSFLGLAAEEGHV